MRSGQHRLWRAVKAHVEGGHKLRVQRVSFHSSDLELYCVYCGRPVLAGGPVIVNAIANSCQDYGAQVFQPKSSHSSIKVH